MSVRLLRLGKRKVWQARVAFHGLRRSAVRATKADAREAEAALLQELRRRTGDLRDELTRLLHHRSSPDPRIDTRCAK